MDHAEIFPQGPWYHLIVHAKEYNTCEPEMGPEVRVENDGRGGVRKGDLDDDL